ncbi:hypothetical protein BRETT_001132 [Brettanomyces bruxellensis]|uniref:TOG domain-containing protein n=1 Tax=Dekkera bruxellensis TaxID=5007 RepID=A0A871R6A2_DEKBR|nr:uncharacterized protein BRETT_001132 [Brettanomyces bruxellensis]QOU21409.1 hypothetical protein BRETT_001132 [Brettanomyces bruxellensis]
MNSEDLEDHSEVWSKVIAPELDIIVATSSSKILDGAMLEINTALKSKDGANLSVTNVEVMCLTVFRALSQCPFNLQLRSQTIQMFSIILSLNFEVYSSKLCKFLRALSTRNSAPSEEIMLIEWTAFIAGVLASKDDLKDITTELIPATINLFNNMSTHFGEGYHRDQHKRRLFTKFVAESRLFYEAILTKQPDSTSLLVCTIMEDRTSVNGRDAQIGFLSSVCRSLKLMENKPKPFQDLSGLSQRVIDWFVNSTLEQKNNVTYPSIELFGEFVSTFVDEQLFVEILSGLQKSSLRSSELTYTVFAPSLMKSIDSSRFDTVQLVVKSKFFQSLISSLKSSRDTVKAGSAKVLSILASKITKESNLESVDTLITKLLSALKSLSATATEQKILISQVLTSIPEGIAQQENQMIINGVLPLLAKDSHEESLSAYLRLVFKFVSKSVYGTDDQQLTKKIDDVIKNGLQDRRLGLRSCWVSSLAENLLLTSDNSDFYKLITDDVLRLLSKIIIDCCKSPLSSVTNDLILGGYSAIWMLEVLKSTSENKIIGNRVDKLNFLEPVISLKNDFKKPNILGLGILKKITTEKTQKWFILALLSIFKDMTSVDEEFGFSFLYLCTSRCAIGKNHFYACNYLHKAVVENQDIVSQSCLLALNKFISNPKQNIPFRMDYHYFHDFIFSLTKPFAHMNKEILNKTLVDLLIPCHYHGFKSIGNGWAGICQSCKVDPGKLVTSYANSMVEKLCDCLANTDSSPEIYSAACDAVATISFVSPNSSIPLLSEIIKADLNVVSNLSINDETFAIWKGKDGVLAIDVLKKNNSQKMELRKNTKDYEILKWEQQVREEVATKQKGTKKVSKEDAKLIAQELEREANLRASINADYLRLKRGLSIVISLSTEAKQVDNNSQIWFPVAISHILKLLESDSAKRCIGDLAKECFLTMSEALEATGLTGVSSLKWIGASTLRSYGVKLDMPLYESRNLTELVGSQLFSLKISSEKAQLSSLVLMYILPLLIKTLNIGTKFLKRQNTKVELLKDEDFVDESPEEEQLALALSIIATNSDSFEDSTIPRTDILNILIRLLAIPSHSHQAKDCFIPFSRSIAVDISDDDLNIILKACIHESSFVRGTVLNGLDQEYDLSERKPIKEIWIACFDCEEPHRLIANTIWEESHFALNASFANNILPFLKAASQKIRISVAESIAMAVKRINKDKAFCEILLKLLDLYRIKSKPLELPKDEFGLVISNELPSDSWEERSGVALTIKFLAPLFSEKADVEMLFHFLVDEAALADRNDEVKQEMKDAGMAVINAHGKSNVEVLIPILEDGLSSKFDNTDVQDRLKEGVIVLYGNLAHHLDEKDHRRKEIVSRLLEALKTPSEEVQFAISQCISPLVGSIENELSEYLGKLFDVLYNGKNLAERKGAAYGIAGLAKGGGLKTLSGFDIISNLEDASDDKSTAKKREGVMFAIECLSESFGSIFEPYVLELLPIVLKSFGDSSSDVRKATSHAAREIMKNTTSYGIQKLIPIAIENLQDISWRAKKGSVQLLGSMAYLDPAQLSSSLPKIVPEIVGVMNDSHKEVRKSADRALKKFGEVIRNPEIKAIVPELMNAIGDPTKYTTAALDSLINTQFVHYIDGPSMALIIHVIDRGMHDRSAATKKKASQIIGNMSILVDIRDLLPYLPKLLSELQDSIVDPVPQTRATAARALGTLVERLGEERFPGLVSKLLLALKDHERPADRMGSAQALAEVIRGLGISKLDELLPEILSEARSSDAYVCEGYLPMLLFLPACFGNQFSPYLSRTIPIVLNGLANSDSSIRDIALKAGRLIVSSYANKAIDLLLPELEKGMSDDNDRIRLSSVELTGDLLFKISGISGNQALSEDPTILNSVVKAFNEVLGEERRDHILSALFICRSDTYGAVRIGSANIWKALVANTPRTIKKIMPSLIQLIVCRLASPVEEQRNIAAAALGDMAKRAGSNALSVLLPTLEKSLITSDSDAKQGICIALRELIESSAPETISQYSSMLVRIVRSALTDANPDVRTAAAQAFDALQGSIGHSAVDDIIPELLERLGDEEQYSDALSALEEIMAKESNVVFPVLIPALLRPPIKAKALGSLAQFAGRALYSKLSLIFDSLINAILEEQGDRTELTSALSSITLSINDDEGCYPLMQQIMGLMRDEEHEKQAIAYEILPELFSNSKLNYSAYVNDIVVQCIYALDDDDKSVSKNSFLSLSALIPKLSKNQLEQLVEPAEQTLSLIGKGKDEMYAFSQPRGPNCLLPIFLRGLMYGDNHRRELSANGIAFIVKHTPAAQLRPFVTIIVGPLIRVIGERFSGDVKSAILLALNLFFDKIPQFLRPFIPQLQRTFIKSLEDASNELLRTRAAKALGTLIKYQPRVDPLILELLNCAKIAGSENIGTQTSILQALLEVVDKAGSKMSEKSKSGVITLVENEVFKENVGEDTVVSYARLTGCLSKILTTEETINMVKGKVLHAEMSDSNSSRFAILVLNAFLKDSPKSIVDSGLFEETCSFLIRASQSTIQYVSDNATIAIGKLLLGIKNLSDSDEYEESIENLVEQLCILTDKPASQSMDTRRLSLVVIRTICRYDYETTIEPYLDTLIPSVFACVRDSMIPIKLAAEKCLLALTKLVEDPSNKVFISWMEGRNSTDKVKTATGKEIQIRSISEYIKRVGSRLAKVERERLAAGGDREAMFSDQFEDEREIWAVGGVDLRKE